MTLEHDACEKLMILNFTAHNGNLLAYGLFETLSHHASQVNRPDIKAWFQEINVDLMNICPEFAPPFLDVQSEARENIQAIDVKKLVFNLCELSTAVYLEGDWKNFPKDDVNRILEIINEPVLKAAMPQPSSLCL